jgi:hypothetical protein
VVRLGLARSERGPNRPPDLFRSNPITVSCPSLLVRHGGLELVLTSFFFFFHKEYIYIYILFFHKNILSAFRPRGVPGPTSKLSPRAPAQMGRRETEREGGRKPEGGRHKRGNPLPSWLSRAQVGCACSRGLQASVREGARGLRVRRPVLPRAANPL